MASFIDRFGNCWPSASWPWGQEWKNAWLWFESAAALSCMNCAAMVTHGYTIISHHFESNVCQTVMATLSTAIDCDHGRRNAEFKKNKCFDQHKLNGTQFQYNPSAAVQHAAIACSLLEWPVWTAFHDRELDRYDECACLCFPPAGTWCFLQKTAKLSSACIYSSRARDEMNWWLLQSQWPAVAVTGTAVGQILPLTRQAEDQNRFDSNNVKTVLHDLDRTTTSWNFEITIICVRR